MLAGESGLVSRIRARAFEMGLEARPLFYPAAFRSLAGYSPLVATQAQFVLLGGIEVGPNTLLRWYVLHVLALPFVLVIFLSVHFWRIRKDGGISGPL